MTFGWEGFSLNHRENWSPQVLSGGRDQGYVRIASPGRQMLQIRWQRLRRAAAPDLFLEAYLGKLARDAKRSGAPFSSTREPMRGFADERVGYRYHGSEHGRGIIFTADDGRTFVLEVVSAKNDPTLPVLREAAESFASGGETDRWSAFGLDLALPKGLRVERRDFLAGKTAIDWRAPGVRMRAERWGLAEQLLARHDLTAWAKALLCADRAIVAEEGGGIRLTCPAAFWGVGAGALVRHQPERNQIVVVRSLSRDPRWRPEWDWLN